MKWWFVPIVESDSEGEESVFLFINGCKARKSNGQEYEQISGIGAGSSAEYVKIAFANGGCARHLKRADFDTSKNELSAKFRSCTTSSNFIAKLISENGTVKRLKRPLLETLNSSKSKMSTSKQSKKRKQLVVSRKMPSEDQAKELPYYSDVDQNIVIDDDKFVGMKEVDIDQLDQPPQMYQCRDLSEEWIEILKDKIIRSRSSIPTILPVMTVPKDDTVFSSVEPEKYWTLGGNHVTKAIKAVLPALQRSENIRKVRVEVFRDLSPEEAISIGNKHNGKCQTLQMTFQDKLRQARKIYIKEGINHLGKNIARMIQEITMNVTKEASVTTITSVAQYSDTDWGIVEAIMGHHDVKNGGTSMTSQVFKAVQGGLLDTERTSVLQCYLQDGKDKALELAKKMKKEKRIKQCIVLCTECQTFDEAVLLYPSLTSNENLTKYMEHDMDQMNIPMEIFDDCKEAREGIEGLSLKIEIQTKIKVNGVDVTEELPVFQDQIKKSEMKLKKLVMKKRKFILDHINANSIVQETQLSQSDPTFVPNTEE